MPTNRTTKLRMAFDRILNHHRKEKPPMNKSVFVAAILLTSAVRAFGQYGYDDSWDRRPVSSQENDGWDYRDMGYIAQRGAVAVSQNPEIRRDVAKGAQKAKRGIKAVLVAIGAAIVGFFKWLSNLFSGKKGRQ